jgi:deazaflavin-dependent oxidoreductase (nitroreductase family)
MTRNAQGTAGRNGAVTRLVARFTNLWTHAPRASSRLARLHAGMYRATNGRFLPRWFFRAPVMVLETTGRASGRRRATPVLYLRDGESLVVVPANAGSHDTPAWWLNLRSSGEGTAVIGRHRRRVRPREATAAERARLWPQLLAMYPAMDDYLRFTDRHIPVVILETPPAHEQVIGLEL